MYHDITLFAGSEAEVALLSFLEAHIEPLLNAAGLIGGEDAIHATARLYEHLCDNRRVTSYALKRLRALLSLLKLDHLNQVDKDAETSFLSIDPADPAVAEICWLTDQLEDHITAFLARGFAVQMDAA